MMQIVHRVTHRGAALWLKRQKQGIKQLQGWQCTCQRVKLLLPRGTNLGFGHVQKETQY